VRPKHRVMSALPPKSGRIADIGRCLKGATSGIMLCGKAETLFDDPIGNGEQLVWNCKAELSGGLEVDD
jgi:hypothetical protein